MSNEEKKSLYKLWEGLGLKEEFREILDETEKIYWHCEEKRLPYTSVFFKTADFLKQF